MRKKLLLLAGLVGLLVVLSGCTNINTPIDANTEGIWSHYFVYPLSVLLKFFAKHMNGSFGLAIIVVTIIIRLILLPLNIKQLKSSKAMQDIQPQLKELQKKYSSKDQKTQQKLQQETMQLFQKNGVNPLAGCLPIFIQMPILIAFYHAIRRTEEIQEHQFLWFELGSPDPYYILPIIAGIATFLQQKLLMAGNPAGGNTQMNIMLYMMPIMITFVGLALPSALPLYWLVGNVFMLLQTVFIRKPMMNNNNGGDKK